MNTTSQENGATGSGSRRRSGGTNARHTSTSGIKTEDLLRKPRSLTWRISEQYRLLKLQDWFFSVELTSLWRRHLVWSHKGTGGSKEMLDIVTGRFASTQIFLSLLFATEVGTYYSPSKIVTDVRDSLRTGPFHNRLQYATGIMLIVSIILTAAGVLANYTAWGVFRCVGKDNAATILRSDIGLYSATLPSRLTFVSILTFLTWNVMFWWINVQDDLNSGAICLTVLTVVIIGHVIATFSALARLVMNTSAMGPTPIVPRVEEETLLPHELTNVLLAEAQIARRLQIKVNHQYKYNSSELEKDSTGQQAVITYEMSLRRRFPDIQVEEHISA